MSRLLSIVAMFAAMLCLGCAGFTGESYQAKQTDSLARFAYADTLQDEREPIMAKFALDTGEPLEIPIELSLEQAIKTVLSRHPALSGAQREIEAREAEVLQAGLLSNPELEVEIEEVFGGSKTVDGEEQDLSGIDSGTATLMLSQLFELGGKRLKRRYVAQTDADLAVWDLNGSRLEVLTQTHSAFIDVLAAQEKLVLAEDLLELARTSRATVQARVDAGKVSPLEDRRARVELAQRETELDRAREALEKTRRKLATMWGQPQASFERVVGDLTRIMPLPDWPAMGKLLEQNPQWVRGSTETENRQATLDLERSKRIPDLTLSAGTQYFNENDNYAFVLGFSIPIPLFDRNQGGISAAESRLAAAADQQADILRGLRSELAETYGDLAAAYLAGKRLQETAIPVAEEVYLATLEGYQQGKFPLTDVLDTQRELFEIRSEYVEVLAEYHKMMAELEGLVAQPLDAFPIHPNQACSGNLAKEPNHE